VTACAGGLSRPASRWPSALPRRRNRTTATGLTAALLAGGPYVAWRDAGPTWDLTANWPIWPILSTSLDCASTGCPAGTNPVTAAAVQFPHAFQTQGEFVGISPGDFLLNLWLFGANQDAVFPVPIHGTVLTFQPQRSGAVTSGTIAGAVNASELFEDLPPPPDGLQTSLCGGSDFESIVEQIFQACDIVLDGDTVSNGPGRTCNAISIGLGFDAVEIAPPTQIVDPLDAGDGCD
jgi:hypothetical protein